MQLIQTFRTSTLARVALAIALTATCSVSGSASLAQGLFSPAISVNADVVTYYELEQRAQLYRLLRTPGNPVQLAREALIDDRLKKQAVNEAGLEVSDEDIKLGIDDFAKRATMTGDEFLAALKEGGVDPETFREFTRINMVWGDFIRQRFLARARPTEAEIDRALGRLGSGGGVRVLLSEIIIPITAENAPQVEALAVELSQISSTTAFSEAAAKYSATDTRSNGGRLDWLPITDLPPDFRPLLLALRPGEVTDPISLPNAVALFQMRDVQEIAGGAPRYAAIEYAMFYIPGGQSEEARKTATEIKNRVDTCDDLYGIAKDLPPESLGRETQAPNEIPRDIALQLAKLDEGEISTQLTVANGQTLVLLMLCGRSPALGDEDTRNDLITGLIQQRLNAFSTSFLDQVRADAVIIEK